MKLIACVFVSVFAINAHAANLAGKWEGTGKASDTKGWAVACESMRFEIVHTATALNVSSYFVCNGQKLDAPGGNLAIVSGNLLQNGTKVGTITDGAIDLRMVNGDQTLVTAVRFTDRQMNFKSASTLASTGVTTTFEGVVGKK